MNHAYVMSLLNRDIPQVARMSSHVNIIHYVGYHTGVLTQTLCKVLQYPEYLDRTVRIQRRTVSERLHIRRLTPYFEKVC